MNERISVLLSTYNEPCEMILSSIQSILNQTYKKLEIILINDNPEREDLDKLLCSIKAQDERVIYIKHKRNKGLVKSLNEGINEASGEYIARMDADDISYLDRLELQLQYMKEKKLDFVGCNVVKIDEEGNSFGEILVPSDYKNIIKFNKYGSCMLHPTWLIKKEVYEKLNGYREIYACEDYDFIVRAIQNGIPMGNLPEKKLFYRIRKDGISNSANIKQMLTMYYIVKNRKQINELTIDDFNNYLNSNHYKKNKKRLTIYEDIKTKIRVDKKDVRLTDYIKIIFNKYFYINMLSHKKLEERVKYCK